MDTKLIAEFLEEMAEETPPDLATVFSTLAPRASLHTKTILRPMCTGAAAGSESMSGKWKFVKPTRNTGSGNILGVHVVTGNGNI